MDETDFEGLKLFVAKVLIVEDNAELIQMLRALLEHENHLVETLSDGTEAGYALKLDKFDLIILDWELPGKHGVDLCREFRSAGGDTPILILTGRREIEDKETGFDSGADDYLTKPFHPRELISRVKALLRRAAGQVELDTLRAFDLELSPSRHVVARAGVELSLLPKEFSLLEFLLRHPNQVFSNEALLERVWQSDSEATAEAVKSTMKRLRKKVDGDSETKIIHTVHGVGYILKNSG